MSAADYREVQYVSLFPPIAPNSLRDPSEIASNDWRAFSSLDRLSDHWSRPAWPDGAEAYYWLLRLGDMPELRKIAAECQEALLTHGHLDPVPLELLHITLHRVAAPHEVEPAALAAVAERAGERLADLPAFELFVGPLAGSSGAIRFSVTPWDRLLELYSELVAATNEVLGETPAKGLRPHMSIAYNSLARAAAPMIKAVSEMRLKATVRIPVAQVELVLLKRCGRTYQWSTLHSLGLLRT